MYPQLYPRKLFLHAAAALQKLGKNTLLIDLDSQGNATSATSPKNIEEQPPI
jgi:cellulose biosynthesis protein BcsQ